MPSNLRLEGFEVECFEKEIGYEVELQSAGAGSALGAGDFGASGPDSNADCNAGWNSDCDTDCNSDTDSDTDYDTDCDTDCDTDWSTDWDTWMRLDD